MLTFLVQLQTEDINYFYESEDFSFKKQSGGRYEKKRYIQLGLLNWDSTKTEKELSRGDFNIS